MSFWDKLEKMTDKLAASVKSFENKANAFLDKNFPEVDSEKPTYNSQQLLALAKSRAMRIAGDRLLTGLKLINKSTSKLWTSGLGESEGVYDGLDIATATIEQTLNKYTKLSDIQYKITLKGLVAGEDDYGSTSAQGKYEIVLLMDEHAEYIIETVKVIRRW